MILWVVTCFELPTDMEYLQVLRDEPKRKEVFWIYFKTLNMHLNSTQWCKIIATVCALVSHEYVKPDLLEKIFWSKCGPIPWFANQKAWGSPHPHVQTSTFCLINEVVMSGRKGIHMPLHMAHFRPFLYFLFTHSLGTSLSSPAICSSFTKPLNVASTQAGSPEMGLK